MNFNGILNKAQIDKISKIVASNPINKNKYPKQVVIRPILLKSKKMFQVEKIINNQAMHENISDLIAYLGNISEIYKQINVFVNTEDMQILTGKRPHITRSNLGQNREINLTHDKQKNHIFHEGMNIPAFVDLGIFSKDFKLRKEYSDKFKQINKFVEIIDAHIKITPNKKFKVIDFGCGKSYLTFFVYYYLKFIKKLDIEIICYDLKSDVVDNCNEIAKKYHYDELKFIVADIKVEKETYKDADMIITLHACDEATDYALFYAIKYNVKNIFSVPCCQHQINQTISSDNELNLILKHGLYKERFSAILTDTIRCELLSNFGYNVNVCEFVPMENTPKIIMIVGNKTNNKMTISNDIEKLLSTFNCNQRLYTLLKEYKR